MTSPGCYTMSGRFLKCGSVHTLKANIGHSALASELQTRTKTTNMAGVHTRRLSREVYIKGFELLKISI